MRILVQQRDEPKLTIQTFRGIASANKQAANVPLRTYHVGDSL
jgi:hypothetical protein